MKATFWRFVPAMHIRRACFLYASTLVWLLFSMPCKAGPTETVALAYFTFETSQPSNSAPAGMWYTNLVAEFGSGTASALHQQACDYSSPTGNHSFHSFGANNWSPGDFWQFTCSSSGASNIAVNFDLLGSATGPATYQLQYSVNGSSFTNFGPIIPTPENGELPDTIKPFWSSVFYHYSTHFMVDLSPVTVLNSAHTIWFRLVDVAPNSIVGGPIGPYGAGRVDNFVVFGTMSTSGRVPPITWPRLAPITYGVPLGDGQLNATSSVAGTFTYVPPAGTVLNSGISLLTAIFTSADTNFDSTMAAVNLSVSPAPLVVSAFNAARTAGTTNPIFSGSVYGLVNGDNITATYSCSATVTSVAGDYSIVPALSDPNSRLTNYMVGTNVGTLTVSTGAVEEVILAQWNFNATNLPSAVLAGGTWYTNISAQLGSGTAAGWHQQTSVYWNMTNGTGNEFSSSNWNVGDFWQFIAAPKTARGLSVVWHQASSGGGPKSFISVASSEFPEAPPQGIELDSATNGTPYAPCGETLAAAGKFGGAPGALINNSASLVLNLTGGIVEPTNVMIRLTDASLASASGGAVGPVGASGLMDLTIYGAVPLPPGTPVIWWTPQPINYGTPLGPAQLNATASTYGAFNYQPGAGTILPAGTNILSVVFTPSDTNEFNVTNTVNLVVTYAPNPTLIQPTVLSPGVFQFTISNVVPGASYTVLSATNLLTPTTNWTIIGSASYLSPGLYQFTDTNTIQGANFYIIRTP